MSKETYLGDGLYASWDGFMLTLRAPRLHGDHWVALEPEVYEALLAFVASLHTKHPAASANDSDEASEHG